MAELISMSDPDIQKIELVGTIWTKSWSKLVKIADILMKALISTGKNWKDKEADKKFGTEYYQ